MFRTALFLQIAQELDAAENSFMMEGGAESEDYLKYIAEGSGNVAADGMFSSQVGSHIPFDLGQNCILRQAAPCDHLKFRHIIHVSSSQEVG